MAKYHSKKNIKGLRWKEHPSRKHGMKPDKYFFIYYQMPGGKRREESCGWSSEGMTEAKALKELAIIKEHIRFGEGYQSLREKRDLEQTRRDAEVSAKEKEKRDSITFEDYWNDNYLPAQSFKKPLVTKTEQGYFTNWIKPYIGAMSFKDIYPLHIEKIKKAMTDKEKAPRSIEYVLSIIRQEWNMAKRDGLIDRESPTKQVKKPKYDNKRMAFFSHEQAEKLFTKLKGINITLQEKSEKTNDKSLKEKALQLHNMSLLSLHTGMRAGEIYKLKWADINLQEGIISIKDAKAGSRTAYMTGEVKAMFEAIKPDNSHANELIFKTDDGEMIERISNSFDRVVDDLEFNVGITDRRQKLTFHSLRHTYASWLVMQGTPLYTVQRLLGHKTIALTERYAHLAPDTLKAAVNMFEKNLKKQKKSKVVNLRG
jgi:integrase